MVQFGYNSPKATKKNGGSMLPRNGTIASMTRCSLYLDILTYWNCSRWRTEVCFL